MTEPRRRRPDRGGDMMTPRETADYLGLHVNTVKRLADRGELPFYRVCRRGDRRFHVDDVDAYLAKNRVARP